MSIQINEQNNDFRNSDNNVGIQYTNSNIQNLTNNLGSRIKRLKNTTTISIPSLFNINTIFVEIYFYLGFFNVGLVLVLFLSNNFHLIGIILFLTPLLLLITLINKSKLIIEKERIIFKDKVIYINKITNIHKRKYLYFYNFIDISIDTEVEPIRIFVKNEDDANNIFDLKYM